MVWWSIQANLGLVGHAGAQLIQVALIRLEAYPHRQPLYDLDIVSSRILGREQAGSISSRGWHILDLTIKRLIEGIHRNGYALPNVHLSELCLLEVRGRPNIVNLDHHAKEETPLGTGGALRAAREYVADAAEFLVTNGASFLEIGYREFSEFDGQHSEAVASVAVVRIDDASRYRTVHMDLNHRVTAFAEKTAKTRARARKWRYLSVQANGFRIYPERAG